MVNAATPHLMTPNPPANEAVFSCTLGKQMREASDSLWLHNVNRVGNSRLLHHRTKYI